MKAFAVLLLTVAVCSATKQPTYDEKPTYVEKPVYSDKPVYTEQPVYEPKPYNFGYDIKEDYDANGRQETSDGKVVTGSYHLNLPDGRKQIVTYKADPVLGFVADVQYVGEAVYPDHVEYQGPDYRVPVKPVATDYPSKPAYDKAAN